MKFLFQFAFFCLVLFPCSHSYGNGKYGVSENDCITFFEGENEVKLPSNLASWYIDIPDSALRASCRGQYQLPFPKEFTTKIKEWTHDASIGDSFSLSMPMGKLQLLVAVTSFSDGRFYTEVSIDNKEIYAVANLSFKTGYLSPDKEKSPMYTDNVCPIFKTSDFEADSLWVVFPLNGSSSACKELK